MVENGPGIPENKAAQNHLFALHTDCGNGHRYTVVALHVGAHVLSVERLRPRHVFVRLFVFDGYTGLRRLDASLNRDVRVLLFSLSVVDQACAVGEGGEAAVN